jgi:hypothetical protein
MLAAFKAIPVFAKIFLGSLLLLTVYGLSHRHHARSVDSTYSDYTPASERPVSYREQADAAPSGPSEAEQTQQALAYYQAQQAQVQAQVAQCVQQSNQAQGQMAMSAMYGQMPAQVPCAAYMPQWTAQEAMLETQIYRLQSGDTRSSMRDIVGIPAPQYGGASEPSYYRPSTPENDGGIGAVERADRQGIRGTSIYAEEDGTEHELPTQPYYFRDRSSGRMVPSNVPTPPNDGRDYDPVTAQE